MYNFSSLSPPSLGFPTSVYIPTSNSPHQLVQLSNLLIYPPSVPKIQANQKESTNRSSSPTFPPQASHPPTFRLQPPACTTAIPSRSRPNTSPPPLAPYPTPPHRRKTAQSEGRRRNRTINNGFSTSLCRLNSVLTYSSPRSRFCLPPLNQPSVISHPVWYALLRNHTSGDNLCL